MEGVGMRVYVVERGRERASSGRKKERKRTVTE
jgi:hypothetical protein